MLEEVFALLSRRGLEVSESIPETAAHDLDMLPAHDLYVLKARTPLAISIAGLLHERGARLLNPYPPCAALLNKVVATTRMRVAGIPTPRSWTTVDPSLLPAVAPAGRVPLVLKPFDGIHSRSIAVARGVDEFARGQPTDGPLLVQEFIEGCERRIKVHCVGDRVFATWKPFSLGGSYTPGQPTAVGDELREVARRCARLFGLGLFGMDVLETPAGPVVVDVNSFPGYKGVPSIAGVIADYIEDYAHGRIRVPDPPGPTRAPVD